MKKLMFSVLVLAVVMVVLVFAPMAQADRTDRGDLKLRGNTGPVEEMSNRLMGMRAVLAAEGHTFQIGENEAMNYQIDQLCGLNPNLAGPEDAEFENPQEGFYTVEALPVSFTGKCGGVRNQGSCGSCWAFGITGAIESQWAYVTGTYYDFSERYLLDCNTYGYSCNGGWFTAFNDCKYPKYFKYESCYPYSPTKRACTAPTSCNADYCTSWAYVGSSSGVPSASSIKQKIYDHGAVTAAVYVDSYWQAYTSGCFTRNASGSVNHAIVLCGWDDNKCGTGVGAWKLKNSWGTSWGESGFMWIKYGCQQVGYAACYANY
ncbi:MAG: C1 family peptidase [Candidatus Aminicenantes bacterium]|nr:C1 family peptidase [Candidatus Aminicenantes bacterium]